MKKYLTLILIIFSISILLQAGCHRRAARNTISQRNAQLQMRKDALYLVSQYLSNKAQVLYQRESNFVTILDDNDLDTYQSVINVFKTDDLASQELARRHLQKNLDPNTYSISIQLLNDKAALRHTYADLENNYKNLENDTSSFEKDRQRIEYQQERREDAWRDYMMMNAIIQSGRPKTIIIDHH